MKEKRLNNMQEIPFQGKKEDLFGSVQKDLQNQVASVIDKKDLLLIQKISRRIYFVRHGESIEDEKNNNLGKYLPQGEESGLSETGKKQMQESGKKLKEMGLKKEDTLFIYADDTKRVIESLDILLNEFGVVGIIHDERLKTSQKEITEEGLTYFKNRIRLLVDLGVTQETIRLMEDLIEKKEYQGYKHIVLVGHKSNNPGIKESVHNKKEVIGTYGNYDIGNGEILESDIQIDGKDYINYNVEIIIFVHNKNYNSLKKLLNIEHTSIIDFQNKLNVYFIKNPELYSKYVKSEINELRDFCLLKLIEGNDLKTLNEIFLDETFRKSINLVDYKNRDKKDYAVLRYYKKIYPQVIEIRKKSLDERIIKGEDIEPDFNFSNEKYNEVLELIYTGKPIKYIEGKAGAGKSYLLTYIAGKLNEKNLNNNKLPKLYYPVYINLSGEGVKSLDEINTKEVDTNMYEIVFLIDSIDESNITGEDRKKLDRKLLELSKNGRVIITSRTGYQESYDENNPEEKEQEEELQINKELVEILDFTSEQIDDYLQKYFGADNKKIETTKNILLKLNGAGDNPLLLYMICEIVEKYKIDGKNIENITITEVYDKIVDLRLLDWNNKVHNRKIDNRKYLQNIIEGLNEIAYNQLINGKSITKENIKEYILIPSDEALEGLNLLFRKNDETQEYDFVHQSFKEYFAAKYIFEEMKNNPEFDITILKKLDFLGIDFLSTLIKDNEKITELLLSKININNLQYGTEKKLYLIGKIDKKVMFSYLPKIERYYKYGNSKELFFILGLLGGDDCLNFIKTLLNHTSSIRTKAFLELDSKGYLDIDDLIELLENEYEDIRLLALDKLYTKKVGIEKFKLCIHNFSLSYKVVLDFDSKGYLDTDDLILLLENEHEDIKLWALNKLSTKVEMEHFKIFIHNSSIKVKAKVIYYCSKLLRVNYYDIIKLFPYNFKIYEKIIETPHYDGIGYYLQLETGESELIYIKITRDEYLDENE